MVPCPSTKATALKASLPGAFHSSLRALSEKEAVLENDYLSETIWSKLLALRFCGDLGGSPPAISFASSEAETLSVLNNQQP